MVLYEELLFGNPKDKIVVSKFNNNIVITDTLNNKYKELISVEQFVKEYKDMFEPDVLQNILKEVQHD